MDEELGQINEQPDTTVIDGSERPEGILRGNKIMYTFEMYADFNHLKSAESVRKQWRHKAEQHMDELKGHFIDGKPLMFDDYVWDWITRMRGNSARLSTLAPKDIAANPALSSGLTAIEKGLRKHEEALEDAKSKMDDAKEQIEEFVQVQKASLDSLTLSVETGLSSLSESNKEISSGVGEINAGVGDIQATLGRISALIDKVSEKDQVISSKDKELAMKEKEIADLKAQLAVEQNKTWFQKLKGK